MEREFCELERIGTYLKSANLRLINVLFKNKAKLFDAGSRGIGKRFISV